LAVISFTEQQHRLSLLGLARMRGNRSTAIALALICSPQFVSPVPLDEERRGSAPYLRYNPHMRWAIALAVSVGLLAIPAASAKTLTRVVGVGKGGVSVTVRGVDWSALRVAPVTAAPPGRYVLLYPLMESGVPAEPARYYPAEHVACYSWDRKVAGECWRVADSLGTGLASLPLLDGPPTILTRLVVVHRSRNLESNGAVAIELAFARRDHARAAKKRPKACIQMRAKWTGADADRRPTRFWSCSAGLWAGKKLYPVTASLLSAI
jgi:hypothetical protein